MAADQDQEGRTTTEPTYSTFSWMEDTTEEISTKTPIFTPPPTLPTSTSQSNKPLDSSAMEENTTKGETFSQDFCLKSCKSFYPCLPFTFVHLKSPKSFYRCPGLFKTTTRPVAMSWLQWLAAKSKKNKKTTTTTTSRTTATTSTTSTTTTTTPTTLPPENSASTPKGLITVQYIRYKAPSTTTIKVPSTTTIKATTTATEKLVPFNAPAGFEYPGWFFLLRKTMLMTS